MALKLPHCRRGGSHRAAILRHGTSGRVAHHRRPYLKSMEIEKKDIGLWSNGKRPGRTLGDLPECGAVNIENEEESLYLSCEGLKLISSSTPLARRYLM
jgi:hypothetical protein